MTTPIFVVGSGRCGTRLIYRLLEGTEGVTVYHEYCCEIIQKAACLYSMGISKPQIDEIYLSAIHYCKDNIWIDCSNKTSWIIDILSSVFPNAKFLWLVRDGRKVVSSFYHKLSNEIYDDYAVSTLWKWINKQESICPPLEKRYWWNIYGEKTVNQTQFERICEHWKTSNRVIEDLLLHNVPDEQQMTVRLEDLISSKRVLIDTLGFLGVQYDSEKHDVLIQVPQNAIIPIDFGLSSKELKTFNTICGKTMLDYHYDIDIKPEKVKYVL